MSQDPSIYLDHNSTTPIDPVVAEVIAQCYARGYLNPASPHRLGQLARRALEPARSSMIDLLGGQSKGMAADSLILTSGGTESNNLALIGLTLGHFNRIDQAAGARTPGNYQLLISAIEHPSIVGVGEYLSRLGFVVRKISVDRHGVVNLDHLEALLQQPTLLVSIMLANNETGVIQPIRAAVELCQKYAVCMHTDAVQAVAKIPVPFRELGVGALSFTAHKFSGPRGVGGLLLRQGTSLQPVLFGGFQQMALRPGTEDVALTMGMERAIRLFTEDTSRMKRVAELRDAMQSELCSLLPDAVVIGLQAERLPTTLSIAFPGVNRQSFLMAADLAGIAVSTGSACASGSSETSPVLLAMGLPQSVVESAIRISLGTTTTPSEIEIAAGRISCIVKQLRQR